MNDFEAFKEKAKAANVIPVVDTLSADLLTPLAVYLKLSKDSTDSFLLESVEGGETLARYSFIGVDPFLIATGNDEEIDLTDANGTTKISTPMIDFLREHFGKYRVFEDGSLPSFIGGAIGSMNFSCSAWFEPTLKAAMKPGDDQSSFMFFRSIVAFDHAKQIISIVSLVFTDDADADELTIAYEKAQARNAEIKHTLEHGDLSLPLRIETIGPILRRLLLGNHLRVIGQNHLVPSRRQIVTVRTDAILVDIRK